MDHAREIGISVSGCLATAGLDLEGGPHWLTALVGALTAIYIGYKIVLVRLEIKAKKKELENESNL